MRITDYYNIYYKDSCIGTFYIYDNGKKSYSTGDYCFIGLEKEPIKEEFKTSIEDAASIPFIEEILIPENRVEGRKRPIYISGDYKIERTPNETNEHFSIYSRRAEKGDPDYSEEDHDAPHYEGPHTPEGMREWCSWYQFNKLDDGTYEAELDEAWWWGGGHNDGGTIRRDIPEEWFELPYDEFLENVVTLSAASHYGFTAEDLKNREGLQQFFGY